MAPHLKKFLSSRIISRSILTFIFKAEDLGGLQTDKELEISNNCYYFVLTLLTPVPKGCVSSDLGKTIGWSDKTGDLCIAAQFL